MMVNKMEDDGSFNKLRNLLISTSSNSFSFKYATYAFDGSLPTFVKPIAYVFS